jgi:carbamoyl-phosphate synthase large subunit
MKSVGEVMAIGRTFEETIQKGLRMIGQGMHGFVENKTPLLTLPREGEEAPSPLTSSLTHPTDTRIFAVAKALQTGYTIEQIHQLTMIDRWFLQKLRHIVSIDHAMQEHSNLSELHQFLPQSEMMEFVEDEFLPLLYEAKVYGFTDFQIARALGFETFLNMEKAGLLIRQWRKEYGILPLVNQIDTLAAEYPAQTNYLYLTYT